jgi:hypothetical protein
MAALKRLAQEAVLRRRYGATPGPMEINCLVYYCYL